MDGYRFWRKAWRLEGGGMIVLTNNHSMAVFSLSGVETQQHFADVQVITYPPSENRYGNYPVVVTNDHIDGLIRVHQGMDTVSTLSLSSVADFPMQLLGTPRRRILN